MSTRSPNLIRLSRCLRQQSLITRNVTRVFKEAYRLQGPARRTFTLTARQHVAKPSRPPPPTPKPISRAPNQSSRVIDESLIDPLAASDHSIQVSLRQLDALMKARPLEAPLTFYRAPSHTSFFLLAWLAGGFFVYQTFLFARFSLYESAHEPNAGQPRRLAWWARNIVMVELLGVAGLGTAIVLAPMKLVRRMSLVKVRPTTVPGPAVAAMARPVRERYMLELDVHYFTPLLRPSTLRVPLETVHRKSRLRGGHHANVGTVPFAEAEKFTVEPWTRPAREGEAATTNVMQRALAGLGRVWPAFARDTKRMFMRDQMDYITVPNQGMFKVDLQESFLLDEGRPFVGLLDNIENVPSYWQRFRMMLSNK